MRPTRKTSRMDSRYNKKPKMTEVALLMNGYFTKNEFPYVAQEDVDQRRKVIVYHIKGDARKTVAEISALSFGSESELQLWMISTDAEDEAWVNEALKPAKVYWETRKYAYT